MNRIKELLNRKFLGLKGLYWLGIFVLGIGVYAWFMRSNIPSPTAEVTDEVSDTEVTGETGDVAFGEAVPSVPSGTVVVQQPVVDSSLANNAIQDNATWVTRGVQLLVGQGVSGSIAQTTLQTYLAGGQLSTVQRGYVDRVIKEFGIPPFNESTSQVTDTPAAAPVRYVRLDGAQGVIYRVESDGSLTPFSKETWSTYRMTPEGSKAQVTDLTGNALANARAAKKNPPV